MPFYIPQNKTFSASFSWNFSLPLEGYICSTGNTSQFHFLKVFQIPFVVIFFHSLFVSLREAITGGLRALKSVIAGGDTFMNLGLEMVGAT